MKLKGYCLIIMSLVAFFSSCKKKVISSRTKEGAQTLPQGDRGVGPVTTAYDWIGTDANGAAVLDRTLTYCYDGQLPQMFKDAIDFAANTINMNGLWNIARGGNNNGDCPINWNANIALPRLQDHLRIRLDNNMPNVPVGGNNGFPVVPFDEGPSYYPGLEGSPNGPADGIVPPGGAGGGGAGVLAVFRYGFPNPATKHIVAAEILFNVKAAWGSFKGINQVYDPRIVGLHELGHAILLEHDTTLYPDRQRFPCGAFVAPGVDAILATNANGFLDSLPTTGSDDIVNPATKAIQAGADGILDSEKAIPVMFPYGREGQHCINPMAQNEIAFTIKEKQTMAQSFGQAAQAPQGQQPAGQQQNQ